MGLSAIRSVHAGVPVLRLAEELDTANAEELGAILESIADESDILIVDLTDVGFISSAPLGRLLAVGSRMRGRKGALAIAAIQRDVYRVFQMTGLADSLQIFNSVDEAADYLILVDRRRKSHWRTAGPRNRRGGLSV